MTPHIAGNRPALVFLSLLVFALAATALAADDTKTWNYLPSNEIGADAFRAAHPAWDGRGVVVAILDTGVDAFAPGMLATSTGQTKLIDVRDFSTEGNWETALAERDESGTDTEPVFRTGEGLQLRGAAGLPVPPGDDAVNHPVYIGVIAEKEFVNNSDVYDLNDDGDHGDKFGFLVYAAERQAVEAALGVGTGYEMLMDLNETAANTVAVARQSDRVWVVVVDTDGNGDLADEKILRDYRVNYDTFALGSDNAPDSRSLMAWEVNVVSNEDHLGRPEAPTVEFHFDDSFDATGAQNHGHAHVNVFEPILALEVGRAGEDFMFVLDDRLHHLGDGEARRVIGRAGLQERDDLTSSLAGALDDRIDSLLG